MTPALEFDAIILAGGSASRMGGTDKVSLAVGATPMLVSVAQAAAGSCRLILVGPPRPGPVQAALTGLAAGRIGWLAWVQELPPGSGPVAGLRRGLAEATASWLVLLAGDLPFLTATHVRDLLTAGRLAADGSAGAAGVISTDATGQPQWLTSCWRTPMLRSALATYAGNSLRDLLGQLNPATTRLAATPGAPAPWLDCDTPDDLAIARHAAAARVEDPGG